MDNSIERDAAKIIAHVALQTALKYRGFVEADDIRQELVIYYIANSKEFEKWRLAGNNADTFRLMRALFGKAKKHCEIEKAAKCGYNFEDVAWYDPAMLVNLMPLALNPRWDGLSGEVEDPGMPHGKAVASEGSTLLAMVCDVRRVLKGKKWKVEDFDPTDAGGKQRLEWLSEKLGGTYPEVPGRDPSSRRRRMSNAESIARTGENY